MFDRAPLLGIQSAQIGGFGHCKTPPDGVAIFHGSGFVRKGFYGEVDVQPQKPALLEKFGTILENVFRLTLCGQTRT
jgi:hypothetical protein